MASGGSSNISYNWPVGVNATANTANNLTAGNYLVVASDLVLGCVANINIQLTSPSEILITSVEVIDPTCPGTANGSAIVNATGGTGSLSYSWNDAQNQNGFSANNLSEGTYTVSVMDENGCIATATATLIDPAGLIVTHTTVPATCLGNQGGSATITVSGGTGNYAINWNVPGNFNNHTLADVPSGDYLVWIIDNMGCMSFHDVFVDDDCLDTFTMEESNTNNEPVMPISNDSGSTQPGVETDQNQFEVTIHPNPSNGKAFNLQVKETSEIEQLNLVLHDMSGRQLMQRAFESQSALFDQQIQFENELPFGVYILTVKSNNRITTHKIVVK
jgi:hypothetical protein